MENSPEYKRKNTKGKKALEAERRKLFEKKKDLGIVRLSYL